MKTIKTTITLLLLIIISTLTHLAAQFLDIVKNLLKKGFLELKIGVLELKMD